MASPAARRPPFPSPRLRALCAGLLAAALCAACGPGGPKRETDDGGGSDGGGGSTSALSLVAGNATVSGTANANGSSARFNTPRGIAVDGAGNLYVADSGNYAIRKIATDGTVSTFAGLIGASGTADGNAAHARFSNPTALTIDASGNLFVTDGMAIRKITSGADVSTVTTGAGAGFGSDIQMMPAAIAVDSSGNLYVTTGVDTRRIATSLRATQLESGSTDGVPSDLLVPRGVAVDSGNTAWIATLGNTIGRATSGASSVTNFAGTQGTTGSADGNATTVRFQQVVALTVDASGNLYAADAVNNTVRKITSSAVTTTIAGTAGFNQLATGGLPGRLADLHGITNDGKGNLYVTSGNAVAKIVVP